MMRSHSCPSVEILAYLNHKSQDRASSSFGCGSEINSRQPAVYNII